MRDTVDVAKGDGSVLTDLNVSRVFSWKWVKVDLGGGAAEYVRATECTVTAIAVAEEEI